jgi:hypothetical protein
MFRRTATTQAEAHGLPLSDRMPMMGRSRAAMTMHYTMADQERHRAGMDRIMEVILRPAGYPATPARSGDVMMGPPLIRTSQTPIPSRRSLRWARTRATCRPLQPNQESR